MAVPFTVLSYGENHYEVNGRYNSSAPITPIAPIVKASKTNGHRMTTHAEENAIRKLPPLPRHKKLKRVDLLVIRANKVTIGSSKPCFHCLLKMKSLPSKGYIIERVFFSTCDGSIVVYKLDELLYSDSQHLSAYYRDNSYKEKDKEKDKEKEKDKDKEKDKKDRGLYRKIEM